MSKSQPHAPSGARQAPVTLLMAKTLARVWVEKPPDQDQLLTKRRKDSENRLVRVCLLWWGLCESAWRGRRVWVQVQQAGVDTLHGHLALAWDAAGRSVANLSLNVQPWELSTKSKDDSTTKSDKVEDHRPHEKIYLDGCWRDSHSDHPEILRISQIVFDFNDWLRSFLNRRRSTYIFNHVFMRTLLLYQ